MNILISAYACEPLKGSEPGVGWNLSLALAKKHHVTIVTRLKNKEPIENYLKVHPVDNIEFIYYDLPQWEIKLKKTFGTQFYCILWNLMLIHKIKKWIRNHPTDLIHHITFNQYRTPAFGFFINKPFVFGPVGGAELIDTAFDQDLESDTLKREEFRRNGNDFKLLNWLTKRTQVKKTIIFSALQNQTRLKSVLQEKNNILHVLPSIAINPTDFEILSEQIDNDVFNMIYAGRAIDWKGLYFFLKAFGIAKEQLNKAKLTLIGIRNEEEREKVKEWILENKLNEKVELINFLPRPELLKKLTNANLFIYPAFRDSGSMAVLEACALGCPTICFEAGGQDAFPNDTIVKVPVIHNDYNQTLNNFSEKLIWAYSNPNELQAYGKRAKTFAYSEMIWEKKAEIISKWYDELLKQADHQAYKSDTK